MPNLLRPEEKRHDTRRHTSTTIYRNSADSHLHRQPLAEAVRKADTLDTAAAVVPGDTATAWIRPGDLVVVQKERNPRPAELMAVKVLVVELDLAAADSLVAAEDNFVDPVGSLVKCRYVSILTGCSYRLTCALGLGLGGRVRQVVGFDIVIVVGSGSFACFDPRVYHKPMCSSLVGRSLSVATVFLEVQAGLGVAEGKGKLAGSGQACVTAELELTMGMAVGMVLGLDPREDTVGLRRWEVGRRV